MQKTETHVKFTSTNRDKVSDFLSDVIVNNRPYAISPILPCKKLMDGKQVNAYKVEVKYKVIEND